MPRASGVKTDSIASATLVRDSHRMVILLALNIREGNDRKAKKRWKEKRKALPTAARFYLRSAAFISGAFSQRR
jgi:hypothetical protein